jgi:hypothetical protein
MVMRKKKKAKGKNAVKQVKKDEKEGITKTTQYHWNWP